MHPYVERFKAPQGEGLFTGTPMAFVRLVGCSVGQGVCTACDTDFVAMRPQMGGGKLSDADTVAWAKADGYRHLCVTGGEPLDRDIRELLSLAIDAGLQPHVETSGTRRPSWPGLSENCWLTVSPKPGYQEAMIDMADEVKVVLGGLGDGLGWPTVEDAVRWARAGKLVYVQPRNFKTEIDAAALAAAVQAVTTHPELRLSAQLHKILGVR